MLKLFQYWKGYILIAIAGDKIERFVNMCSFSNIYIWDIHAKDDKYYLKLYAHDLKKIRPFLKKTNTKFILCEKTGIPFLLFRYRNRKLLFGSILFGIFLLYFFSIHLWRIDIEGNIRRSDEAISAFLAQSEIQPGMYRKEVDCQAIAEQIRSQFSDIVWVSASIDGSRLLIQVKENDTVTSTLPSSDEQVPTDLIAAKDGTIVSLITRAGTPVVRIGDTVKKGDILITSSVEILNDAKEVTGYEYRTADADIMAETRTSYSDKLDRKYEERQYEKVRCYPHFLIGEYYVGWNPPKNDTAEQEILTETIPLISGFKGIPDIYYDKKTVKSYKTISKIYEIKELQTILSRHFNIFCQDLSKKGVQITANSVKIHIGVTSATAEGDITTIESIKAPVAAEIKRIERNQTDESNRSNH